MAENRTNGQPTIAILGASSNRKKFGNKCVRAHQKAGYTVYPVNPSEAEIEGLPVFRQLADVPKPLDRISVYLPPPVTLELVPEIAAAEADKVFFNPGSADPAVFSAALEAGVKAVDDCSIVAIGFSPAQFPAS